jgi:hypothetical protein
MRIWQVRKAGAGDILAQAGLQLEGGDDAKGAGFVSATS